MTQPFELGERVLVHAYVWTEYLESLSPSEPKIIHSPYPNPTSPDVKVLVRQEYIEPIKGIIVGYTWKATGKREGGWDDPPYLAEDKRHKIWLVAHSLRYIEPIAALEVDIAKEASCQRSPE